MFPSEPRRMLWRESDDFDEVARLLANVKLHGCDFADTLNKATCGDFVFVDPPYTVKHDNNGFIKYNEGLFPGPIKLGCATA